MQRSNATSYSQPRSSSHLGVKDENCSTWCNAERLICARAPGGWHRRFVLSETKYSWWDWAVTKSHSCLHCAPIGFAVSRRLLTVSYYRNWPWALNSTGGNSVHQRGISTAKSKGVEQKSTRTCQPLLGRHDLVRSLRGTAAIWWSQSEHNNSRVYLLPPFPMSGMLDVLQKRSRKWDKRDVRLGLFQDLKRASRIRLALTISASSGTVPLIVSDPG